MIICIFDHYDDKIYNIVVKKETIIDKKVHQ